MTSNQTSKMEPKDAPPTYEAATSSTTPKPTTHHKTRNGIPPSRRRSMEDEARELPAGWVRQYDSKSNHQFFVDTTSSPPRSIWHHPYDDETYLSTLPPSERSRIQEIKKTPSHADIEAESSEDDSHHPHGTGVGTGHGGEHHLNGATKLGRKVKDKLTSSTHEQRAARRLQREEEERRVYEQHLKFRQAMQKAEDTGVPQYLGRDREGKEVYIESPYGTGPAGGYGAGQVGYNPYAQGPYANPNARFVRPEMPYQRPYGSGYGGGLGYGAPLLGLGTGFLLGGLLF